MAFNLKSLLDRDITYSVSNQVLVSGLNFAIGIIAARALGVSDFGLFSLILLMASFTSNIEGQLITLPMMTVAGSRAKRSDSYFSTIMVLGLGFAMISAIIIALFVTILFLLRGQWAEVNLILASGLIAFSQNVQVTTRRILFARSKRKQAVALDLLRLGIMSVFIGYLVTHQSEVDVSLALYVLAVSALLATLPFMRLILKARVPRRLPLKVLRRHWPMSAWMLLMLLVAIGQEQALWIIAGVQFGDEAIGGLRAGQYLLGTTHFLVYALENFMPKTAAQEMRKDDVSGLVKYLKGQTLFVGATSLAVIIPIAVLAEPLLGLFFGQEFAAYAGHTQIFAMIYAVTIIRMIWIYYLRVVERTRDVFVSYVISSALSLAIIFPMISAFGIYGITLTMLVAQSVLLIAIGIHIARHAYVARHDRKNGQPKQLPDLARRELA